MCGKATPASGHAIYFNKKTKASFHLNFHHAVDVPIHWYYIQKRYHPGYRIFGNGMFELREK